MEHLFNLCQLAIVSQSLKQSESLVSQHYRIPALPSKSYPYEVVTLADIQDQERVPQVLAHLVIYERQRPRGIEHLYRSCLQDDVILERLVEEEDSSLLIYILTHELVHVVRFQRAEQSFLADHEARRKEEQLVHEIAQTILITQAETCWRKLVGNYDVSVLQDEITHQMRKGITTHALL